jgi:CubicO group peptidase (beta-lactamase class C family)
MLDERNFSFLPIMRTRPMTSRTRLAFIALALALPSGVSAQAADSLSARVDSILMRWSAPDRPFCAVGVARDGQTVLQRGYGMANLEYDVAITPATIFETGSVAKQFTAASIVLLAMDGKLSLSDDVRKYIPELPDYGKSITIRHLLNHTSGLRDWFTLVELAGRPAGTYVWSNEEILERVVRQRALNFAPGAEYMYSNSGYVALAIIVARVSGMPLAEFARTRIFEPLGMTHTRHRDDMNRIVKGRATAYAMTPGIGLRTDMPMMTAHGGGGLLTTVGDLLKWNENFVTGTVGGRALIDSLQRKGRLTSGREISYALGLTIGTYRTTPEVSHSGSTAGYQTYLTRFPDKRVSVALLCNLATVNTNSLVHQIADVYLGDLPPSGGALRFATGAALSADQLAAMSGAWFSERTKELVRLTVKEAGLVIDGSPAAVTPSSETRAAMGSGTELIFETSTGERVMRRITSAGDTTLFTATRSAPQTVALLRTFAGRYSNDENETHWTVAVDRDRLTVSSRSREIRVMTNQFADVYRMPMGLVRFTRDPAGRVDGLELYAGRVRSVRFVKEER